jgi:hypothetical protein
MNSGINSQENGMPLSDIESDSMIEKYNKHTVLTFTGLHGVSFVKKKLDLGCGYYLHKPNPYLISARWKHVMSDRAYAETEQLSCFFVLKEELFSSPDAQAQERLQNGVIAMQILKPIKTFGFIFQGRHLEDAKNFNLQRIEERPPMVPGDWALRRKFDRPLLEQVPGMIQRVAAAFNSGDVAKKNAITLLQLSLEHFHPLISGLFAVMGMEALFDSGNRTDFKNKLCDCLGPKTLVFPDWNTRRLVAPKYTVEESAVPLYMLRNKLAHGADLRTAALDKTTPVDLINKVRLTSASEPQAYALLLSQAAPYLLAQVLQRTL